MRGRTVREIGMQLMSKFTVTKTLVSDQAKLLLEFRRVVHDPQYVFYPVISYLRQRQHAQGVITAFA